MRVRRLMALVAAGTVDVPVCPAPEEIDPVDTYKRFRERYPDSPRENAIEVVELLVDRKLTDEELVVCA